MTLDRICARPLAGPHGRTGCQAEACARAGRLDENQFFGQRARAVLWRQGELASAAPECHTGTRLLLKSACARADHQLSKSSGQAWKAGLLA